MKNANRLNPRRPFVMAALAATLVSAPSTLRFSDAGYPVFAVAIAQAKEGLDDDQSGRGGDGHSEDREGHGGAGDDRGYDRSGPSNGDDRDSRSEPEDRSGNGRGGRSDHSDDRDGMETIQSDGASIENEDGRFERKDASGRMIEERPATTADHALFSGSAARRAPGDLSERSSHRGGGVVARLEVRGQDIEITYTDGWKEEIEAGRYELKDNLNRTVIQRRATVRDRDRLFAATR